MELSNGCPAIVIKNNENKLRPVVRMFNVEDDVPFCEVDLMNDLNFADVSITSLGYNSRLIDYNAFITKYNIMPEDLRDGSSEDLRDLMPHEHDVGAEEED